MGSGLAHFVICYNLRLGFGVSLVKGVSLVNGHGHFSKGQG